MYMGICAARHLTMQGWADPQSLSCPLLVTGSYNMLSMPHNHGNATAIARKGNAYIYTQQYPEAVSVSVTDE